MFTVNTVLLERPTTVVISPQKHEYQFLKQDNGCRAITDSSNNVFAYLPSPRISWSQFKEDGTHSDIFAMEHREHVMELQLFHDPRIPGWELATELGGVGGVGGSEIFFEGDFCGKTVRQVFCLAFASDETFPRLLLELLPVQFTFQLQMSLQRPIQLRLTDILSISKTFVTSTYLDLKCEISALKHMPFELPAVYDGHFPMHCQVLLRSKSTGQSTVFQPRNHFAQCLIREIPAKLLFRFLCLRSASEFYVQEYVRLFPKHRKVMRLCRHAVSTWIGQVQQSYYNVNVTKTKTLRQISPNHIPLVRDLHTLYRASSGKTPITFAVVEDWVYHHCHAEDVFGYCEPTDV